MDHKKSVLLTVFVAFLWSTSGLILKMISWNASAIPGTRSLVAALLITPFVMKSGIRMDRNVFGGAVCYCLFNYCFCISTKLTTSAMAIMMQYTAPIYVALLSWLFLKEKIRKADLVNMFFVLAGMVMFFSDSFGGGTLTGNIIAVFNGIAFAGISIFMRLQKNGNPVLSMYFGNIFSAIVGLPIIVKSGMPDGKSCIFLIAAGLMVALTYGLYAVSSKGLSALELVLLPIIDPALNPVWVFLFVGEKPGTVSIIGAVVILASVTLRVLWDLRPGAETASA